MDIIKKKVLETDVSIISEQKLLVLIEQKLTSRTAMTVSCVNAYYAVRAQSDDRLQKIINNFDIVHPDGVGVRMALQLLYTLEESTGSFTGTDFYFKVLHNANARQWKIFLFGDSEEIVETAKSVIERIFPSIRVVGTCQGYKINDTEKLLTEINSSQADILFIGLGMPRQEYWIEQNTARINVPIRLLVGGGIAFISGLRKRAPIILRLLGLEWLYRLQQEPKRLWKRYIFGIPEFCYYIVKQKLQQTFHAP